MQNQDPANPRTRWRLERAPLQCACTVDFSLVAVVVTTALLGFPAVGRGADRVVCPRSLVADAVEPFQLVGRPTNQPAPLEGLQLVEGEPGSEQVAAPVTLAPGRELRRGTALIGVWELAGSRSLPLLIVCRYVGTEAYLRAVLPDQITRCEARIEKLRTQAYCH